MAGDVFWVFSFGSLELPEVPFFSASLKEKIFNIDDALKISTHIFESQIELNINQHIITQAI